MREKHALKKWDLILLQYWQIFHAQCSFFRIIGLCLLQNEMCPLFLNRHVLKYVLGRKIGWHDLAFFDPVMYESLRQLVLDSENKDASLLFAALDMNFFVQLGVEEVRAQKEGAGRGDKHLKYV
jgi:hypothetical protein